MATAQWTLADLAELTSKCLDLAPAYLIDHPSQICDNCGSDIPGLPSTMGMLYQIPVRTCSIACFHALNKTWAPTPLPIRIARNLRTAAKKHGSTVALALPLLALLLA